MAITKIWGVTKTVGKTVKYIANEEKTQTDLKDLSEGASINQSIEDVIAYASNAEKTEKCYYVNGVNCIPELASREFVRCKRANKKDGSKRQVRDKNGEPVLDENGEKIYETVQAYHCVMSFDGYECSPEVAHEIGLEFARRAWGDNYQVVVATHLNTENVHNHFVINSVGMDGKLLHDGTTWWRLKQITDELCKEYGLSVVNEPKRGGESRNWKVHDDNRSGEPTRYNHIKEVVDEAIAHSLSLEDFQKNLRQAGFRYRMGPNQKYWTVTPDGYERPFRLYHLGSEYTNDAIQKRLDDNKYLNEHDLFDPNENWSIDPLHVWCTDRARRYRQQTRKGSYLYLWRYSCYMYGFRPAPNPVRQKGYRTPWQLHQNYSSLNKLNEEAILLSAYDIETFPQLCDFRNGKNEELRQLEEVRKMYRKQLRSAPESEQEKLRAKIAETTSEMREIRHELLLIDDVDKRAGSLAESLNNLDIEMERQVQERERGRTADG